MSNKLEEIKKEREALIEEIQNSKYNYIEITEKLKKQMNYIIRRFFRIVNPRKIFILI